VNGSAAGGLVYFVCVAPLSAYDSYEKTFSSILDSVAIH